MWSRAKKIAHHSSDRAGLEAEIRCSDPMEEMPGPCWRNSWRSSYASSHGADRPVWRDVVRLIRVASYDHASGRDFAARVESNGEKILAEVIRQIGDRDVYSV